MLPRVSNAPNLPQFYWARSFSFSSSLVAVEMFFYMQVHLRSLMDYRYKLYADSCMLQSPDDGARALLSLSEVRSINLSVCLSVRISGLANVAEK